MKTLLNIIVIAIGGLALYFIYSYALKEQPQLKFSQHNNQSVAPNENLIIAKYVKSALEKEKNITTTSYKSASEKEKNITIASSKSVSENIETTDLNSSTQKLEENSSAESNFTIEGELIPTFVENKPLTKEQKERIKAQKESLKKRLKTLKADIGDPIYIRIFKKSKELEIWIKPKNSKNYKLLKDYKICYYSGRLGPKLKEGDGVSPEGFYSVSYGALNPNSNYHLSFNLGFPNEYDINYGRTGSYLMVHGKCVSIGCYAMGDKNIEEIYKLVKEALLSSQSEVMVHIFPFRLEKKELAKYRKNRWYKFWLNLKEGYDAFNKTHIPPTISVDDLKYVVTEANK